VVAVEAEGQGESQLEALEESQQLRGGVLGREGGRAGGRVGGWERGREGGREGGREASLSPGFDQVDAKTRKSGGGEGNNFYLITWRRVSQSQREASRASAAARCLCGSCVSSSHIIITVDLIDNKQ
jgi:hypothetical protein